MRRIPGVLRLVVLMAVLAALAVAACGGNDTGDEDQTPTPSGPTPVPAMVLKSDAPRAEPDASAMAGTARALDLFAADLYSILAREDGNLVMSPYSIMVALAMTRTGANGETLEQMSDVLRAAEAGDLDAGLNALEQELAKRTGEYGSNDEKAELVLAPVNQLWGQDGFPFHDAFLDKLAADYGAGMNLVDYGATEDARRTINAWVSEQTRERIPELLKEGVISASTRLVLTNAIYLNAPWAYPFNAQTTAPGTFRLLDGSTVEAQMMALDIKLRFAEGAGYQAVELPYVDGSLAMVVVVPDEGGFAAFEDGFDADVLAGIVDGLGETEVKLRLPKFEFRKPFSLPEALIEMGMPIPFDGALADFSGMSPQGQGLYIASVVHEAFIAVDELGTEAAAATAVGMDESAAGRTVELSVDRPFMFFIRDNETGALLFMGRVLDPTK